MHLTVFVVNNTRMIKPLNSFQGPYLQDEIILESSK